MQSSLVVYVYWLIGVVSKQAVHDDTLKGYTNQYERHKKLGAGRQFRCIPKHTHRR